MYAVIFKAIANQQDADYSKMVKVMRELAFAKYNCQDFLAVQEGDQEVAISYWLNEDDIKRWHQDSQHAVAQQLGRDKWYKSYVVEVVEVKRRYSFS